MDFLTETYESTAPVNSGATQPMEGIHDTGPLRFLTKTFGMADDPSTNGVVSLSRMSNSFAVLDPHEFAITVLPRFFKHSNFSSFVRQPNTYLRFEDSKFAETVGTGLQDGNPGTWEFASEGFRRGQKHLLKTLKRRKAPSHLSSQQFSAHLLEVGQFGFDREIDQLRRDKNILMAEIVKLRQEQQSTLAHFMAMEARLQGMEQKQLQIMVFLACAPHNPNFLHQLAQLNDRNKELEQPTSEKRRRPIYQGSTGCDGGTGLECSALVKNEYSYEDSELESLALEMHGFGRGSDKAEEHEGDLTSEFCVELLSEGISEEGASSSEGNEEYDLLSEGISEEGASSSEGNEEYDDNDAAALAEQMG